LGQKQVALIRGINVGRAKRIAMADLRALMESLGYSDCRTLLNSGNVVFDAGGETPERSAARIEQAISRECGFDAPVTVVNGADFSTVVTENPLTEIADNPSRLLVAFLMKPDHMKRLEPLTHADWRPEALALGASQAVYLWLPHGVIKSSLHEAVVRALDKAVTARNWKTVLKIEAALES
jgi:uncharacterized protein (DUF1697 family)